MSKIDSTIDFIKREQEEKEFQALAKKNHLPYVDLLNYPILPDVLNIIPEEIARKEKLVAYLKAGETVKVATSNYANKNLDNILANLKQQTNWQFSLSLCSNSSLNYALVFYGQTAAKKKVSEKMEVKQKTKEEFSQDIKNLLDLKDKIQTVPATELLDILFAGALVSEASDIHLEPQEGAMRIRFRIDGVLQDIAKLPLQAYQTLNSRIKYLAGLKLDIKNQPQDGRFESKAAGIDIDIRVSTLPTSYGEVIEMRLLPKEKKFLSLQEIGFRSEYIKIIRQASRKPQGIIFNTGPTGSGKTTTLYAILSELNKPGVKIITLEDPIEYKIQGIDQSQIEPEKNYTFATGLRSALRQDPDIMMVGEIRDSDTATTAIQAAMTGHLVLTTLHTNNAPASLPRLLDMGVKPYLLGGSINLIIAQRLVRKVCQKCKGRPFGFSSSKALEKPQDKGCEICNKSGYHGRIAIAELLVPNKEIEDLIQKNGTLRDFQQAAKKAGMISMYEDGMEKVKKGITTEEEVMRVTRE